MTKLVVQRKNTRLAVNASAVKKQGGTTLLLRTGVGTTLISSPVVHRLSARAHRVHVVEFGTAGPAGAKGDPGTSRDIYSREIPAGETRLIQSFEEDGNAKRWDVTLEASDFSSMSYQIKGALALVGSQFDWSKYSILGVRLLHATEFVVNGTTIEYRVTNNSQNTIQFEAISY